MGVGSFFRVRKIFFKNRKVLGLAALFLISTAFSVSLAAAQVDGVNNEAEDCVGESCNSGNVAEVEVENGCIIVSIGAYGEIIINDTCNTDVVVGDDCTYGGNGGYGGYGGYGGFGDCDAAQNEYGQTGVEGADETGSIIGYLTDEAGQRLQNINVTIYKFDDSLHYWDSVAWTYTDANGYYSVSLPDGDYKVRFRSLFGNYISEYYNDKPSLASANILSISQGSLMINAILVRDTEPPSVNISSPVATLINNDSPSINASYDDGAGLGIDTTTVTVYLDGNDVTGSCTVSAGSVTCPTSAISQGSHSVGVGVDDLGGNTGYVTSTFDVVLCSGDAPDLNLSRGRIFWASYADYTARHLSVNYTVSNTAGPDAFDVDITGAVNSPNSVTLASETPVGLGDISTGASAATTLVYYVPVGVSSFKNTVQASATDACGNGFTYPRP